MTEIEFEELMNKVMSIKPYRIGHLLECSLKDSGEDTMNWTHSFQSFLVSLGHDSNSNSNTPHQVNIVFNWLKEKYLNDFRETHKKANWQLFKPVREWSEIERNLNRTKIKELEKIENRDKVQNEFLSLFQAKDKEYQELNNCRKPEAIHYAFYHWIRIRLGSALIFEKDENDKYKRKEIEAYVANNYPSTSPQSFYRKFREMDMNDKIALVRDLGKKYKEIIFELSNNDAEIMAFLKDYPN